jgi:TonB-linked SusC/RagA family outer membrane protein
MIFRNSTTQNYELGITGGNEKTAVNFSFGLMQDRGLLRRDLMRRYNFKIGVDQKIFNKVTVGANVLYTNKKNNKRSSGIFNQALKTGPVGVLYNDDGTYKEYSDSYFTTNQPNPMLDEVDGVYVNEIQSHRVFGSTYLNWEIIKGLVFRSNLGVDFNIERNGLYAGAKSLSRLAVGTPSSTITNYSAWSYTWDNTFTFNKNIDKHGIQVMAGTSVTANQAEKFYINGVGQIAGKTEFYDLQGFSSISTKTDKDNYFNASQMRSYFGRINYKFDEKYLFQFTYRADGSSVLTDKWRSFPSASVGWRASEENFMKNIRALSNLKFRASWGVSGNAAINPYTSLTVVSDSYDTYSFGTEQYSALVPFKSGAKSLDWEYTTTKDFGLDFGLFGGRINGTIDYFKSKTNNLLFYNPLPPSQVYIQVMANVAETEGQGLEVTLNTVNVKAGKFEWNTDWIFATAKDKIVKLRGDVQQVTNPNNSNKLWRVGDNINAFYDYEKVGIYSIDDLQKEYEYVAAQQLAGDSILRGQIPMISNQFLPGDIKLNDANGDGIFNEKDKRLYSETPKFTFGITNAFTYGNWGLRVMVIGRIGQFISSDFYNAYKPADLIVENGPYVDAWTPQNSGAEFPRYYTSGNAKTYKTTLSYVEGSVVKIKDITLSYTLPQSILKYAKISNLKFYGTLKNYFTFSTVDNFDPEIGGTMNFPLAKQIIVGLNLEF